MKSHSCQSPDYTFTRESWSSAWCPGQGPWDSLFPSPELLEGHLCSSPSAISRDPPGELGAGSVSLPEPQTLLPHVALGVRVQRV